VKVNRFHRLACVGVAVTVGGCGLNQAKTAPSITTPSLNAQEIGYLQRSRTLTKPGTAASVVTTFVQDLGEGAGPALANSYSQRTIQSIGVAAFLGSLQVMTSIADGVQPAVVHDQPINGYELVVARFIRPGSTDTPYSFLLHRRSGTWQIQYDSLLAQGLQAYVIGQMASNPSKPSAAAQAAVARAIGKLEQTVILAHGITAAPASVPSRGSTSSTSQRSTGTTTTGTGSTTAQGATTTTGVNSGTTAGG
jgi:hypothetical protein